ncbi:hypothetical protein BO71DRAFT_207841 [Aspergillus ellipticus CBS 707.79]|uniref:Uncharacterized protein n=1 Tax=Aspergillus ellipticus CBS 707.79 TaxID=1448320 RepID=A0A319EV59_9EURO|nr:hypothetical protein BO71DRAFT_207841 [Aspergillus ellipticus CBS 707.79]
MSMMQSQSPKRQKKKGDRKARGMGGGGGEDFGERRWWVLRQSEKANTQAIGKHGMDGVTTTVQAQDLFSWLATVPYGEATPSSPPCSLRMWQSGSSRAGRFIIRGGGLKPTPEGVGRDTQAGRAVRVTGVTAKGGAAGEGEGTVCAVSIQSSVSGGGTSPKQKGVGARVDTKRVWVKRKTQNYGKGKKEKKITGRAGNAKS